MCAASLVSVGCGHLRRVSSLVALGGCTEERLRLGLDDEARWTKASRPELEVGRAAGVTAASVHDHPLPSALIARCPRVPLAGWAASRSHAAVAGLPVMVMPGANARGGRRCAARRAVPEFDLLASSARHHDLVANGEAARVRRWSALCRPPHPFRSRRWPFAGPWPAARATCRCGPS